MKVLFAVAVLAVVLHAALGAPSGLLGLGGVVVAGPTTISRTSLVQTHPSPVLVASPAVHGVVANPWGGVVAANPWGGVVANPWGGAVVAGPTIVGGHGLGHAGLW